MIKYFFDNFFKKYTIVRYVIGGGTSAVINLSTLYFLNSILRVYYITASVIAFIIAFFVSLAFHKFLTFRETSMENIHRQGIIYFITQLFALALNTLILYICVDLLHLQVILGAIIAGGVVACFTFFISKHYIFKIKENKEVLDKFL